MHRLSLVGESRAYFSCGVWDSRCGGFSCCAAQALGAWLSCPMACGIFLHQGLNWYPLQILNHWTSREVLFLLFDCGEYCCLLTLMYRVLLGNRFTFWFIFSSQFAGSYSNFVVNLLRNCQTVFQSGWILYSQSVVYEVSSFFTSLSTVVI